MTSTPPASHGSEGASVKINIGCGTTPTAGWTNFDNSLVVQMARSRLLVKIIFWTRVMPAPSRAFLQHAAQGNIRFANAGARIPCPTHSVEALYSSHMVEHLDRREVQTFLMEARRVLQPGGVIRIAVPDLSLLVNSYQATGDADAFISKTHMGLNRPVKISARLKTLVTGLRHHLWMYDGPSMVRLLSNAGFSDVRIMAPGDTYISAPGSLDLKERASESVYVEGVQPMPGQSSHHC